MQEAKLDTIRVWIHQGMLVADTIPAMRRRGKSDGCIVGSSVEQVTNLVQVKDELYRVNFRTLGLEEQAIWLLAKGGVICTYSDENFYQLIQLKNNF